MAATADSEHHHQQPQLTPEAWRLVRDFQRERLEALRRLPITLRLELLKGSIADNVAGEQWNRTCEYLRRIDQRDDWTP